MNKVVLVPGPLAQMADQEKVREIFSRVMDVGREMEANNAEMALVGQAILAAVLKGVMEEHNIAQANVLAGFLAAIPTWLWPLAEGTVQGVIQVEEQLLFGGGAGDNGHEE